MTKRQVGQEIGLRVADPAARDMRREIDSAGGREVFFAGALDSGGRVGAVRVCARGNEDSVLALLERLEPREVVIHNHPTGDLGPSRADMEVAAACANNGHGVYIVDNSVEHVYVVVEPFLEKQLQRLDPFTLDQLFRPGGALSRILPQFESRPQQLAMLESACEAFNSDRIAVVEAPTGVGKTFAYLLPAIQWAQINRERVVVSTRTINLQEQIVFKDIPLLQKCLKEPFKAVLVKGRSNYLCRRKLARVHSEMALIDQEGEKAQIDALVEWAEQTEDGSRSDLAFMPSREVWERVCSEADTCSGTRCGTYRTCFLTKARREIAKADIIIANHHIVFSDVSVKKELGDFSSLAVLPAYRRVIFDEAHCIEESATEYFGVQATRNGAVTLLGRFVRHEGPQERGLLPFLKTRLIKGCEHLKQDECDRILEVIDNRLLPSLAGVRESVLNAFQALRSLTAEKSGQIGRDVKWRLTPKELTDPDLREVHKVQVMTAVHEIAGCVKLCDDLIRLLKRIPPDDNATESPVLVETLELGAYRARLESLGAVLKEATSEELAPNTVRWIEIDSANKSIVRLVRCPLDVGECLADWLYENLRTVVMTSATLSVQQRFDYFFGRVGLNRVPPDRLTTSILDTPFDFSQQALLAVARDMPEPNSKQFLDATVDAVRLILDITKGHALLLFTSFYALDYAHRRLADELRRRGITPLKQGEANRTQILDRFRQDTSSVLFGTDSFWEGIDVAGEALQCVILPKLPFKVPTEPIQQARAEAIEAGGGNSFMQYTVPQAVIKFRQGFGRLIRRKSDRGAIVVLDHRVAARYYGKVFLESLPGCRVVVENKEDLFKTLGSFYNKNATA